MLQRLLGSLTGRPSKREDDNRVHVAPKDRKAAALKVADAIETIMRAGSDAPADAKLCAGCVLGTVAGATKLLLARAGTPVEGFSDIALLDFILDVSELERL